MNIITKTAFANFKKNRSRNILIGAAIALTAMLLTIVPTVVFGSVDLRFTAVDNLYPTFHGMFRDVDEKAAQKMTGDARMTDTGLREDAAYMVCDDTDASISMVYCDRNTVKLNRLKLKEGELPRRADEIVVSEGLLKVMGLKGGIGDKITVPYQPVMADGLGQAAEKEFTITGMTEDSEEAVEKNIYSALISDKFAEEIIPAGEHRYRVYFSVAGAKGKTTDAIKDNIKEIGKSYNIGETDIVENGEYLFANYVDPAMYAGMVILMVIIVLAGILTIYSIYYVSMMNKVQEYGKLKAIGSTKRQIRQLVFREGFTVAAAAVPVGLMLGLGVGILLVNGMVSSDLASDNLMAEEMKKIIADGGVSLVKPWILLLAAAVSCVSVYISLLRPMQKAAKISAIEAIRFQGTDKEKKKKQRRGYEEMNIRRLTASNLGRNKRRTVVTIVTLGITGILFVVVATILSCMNPKTMAMDTTRGDIHITLNSESGNKMHPERELSNIQKNNPLTEELKEQIVSIDGVDRIETYTGVSAALEELREDDGRPLETGLGGLSEEAMKELDRYVTEGSLADDSLKDGTGIILSGGYVKSYPGADWKTGDKVHLLIEDGDEVVKREFKIVAVTDAPYGLTGNGFILPSSVLEDICENDVTDDFYIFTEKGKAGSVAEAVKQLTDGQEFLQMDTWKDAYAQSEKSIGFMLYGCYGLMFVFGLIGILNLVNTMINSVYIRRRELGVLQAVGLSGKQTVRMLQLEGLFYTAGTLLLSVGAGSIAGYGCFLWARAESIMSIRTYEYPVVPVVVLAAIILVVQILITYMVNNSFKKQSLIDRVRFAE
ncbi:FtsX-like permease family protein [[Clostridium] hylemonae]|uniref:ABC transporter permease n=1 Tax=[Clostridium] hylemonae TaxID=89153 RepID=UPI001D07DCFE|nr:FtsX-like permease family protein [[Clostridium] hylemonae]MCB7520262.1 FtsX-like permease family protein [[Clostridium] hylemonae]